MIINCAHCTCRFRIDDAKVPAGLIHRQLSQVSGGRLGHERHHSAQDQSALGVGTFAIDVTGRRDWESQPPAPLFKLSPEEG